MNDTLDTLLEDIGHRFEVEFEPLAVDGRSLSVLTVRNMREHLDRLIAEHAIRNPLRDLPLWAKIWPGSFVLGRLLRRYEPAGKTLLELGGGCGILSLIAAGYGFSAITTSDINEDALRFARANILKNSLENLIAARFVDVRAPSPDNAHLGSFDCIAASELLYLEELHRPLLKFLGRHLKAQGRAFFCTDHARAKPHFAKLARRQFAVEEGHIGVKSENDDGTPSRRVYDILILSPGAA